MTFNDCSRYSAMNPDFRQIMKGKSRHPHRVSRLASSVLFRERLNATGGLPHSAGVISLALMEGGTPTHYVVVEGLAGEGSTWRVVRAEEHARGRRLYAFVGTCQTRRAALSLARALNEKRAVDEETLRAAALRGQALAPGRADIAPAPDPYRLRPSC